MRLAICGVKQEDIKLVKQAFVRRLQKLFVSLG